MKTAICFRGIPRSIHVSIEYWKKFIQINNCDVFLVTHRVYKDGKNSVEFDADAFKQLFGKNDEGENIVKMIRLLTDAEEQEMRDHIDKLIALDNDPQINYENILRRGYPQYYQLRKMVEALEPFKADYDRFFVSRTDVLPVFKCYDQPNKTIIRCDHKNNVLENCPLCHALPIKLSDFDEMPMCGGYSYSDFTIYCDWSALCKMSGLADTYFKWRPNVMERELYFYVSPEAQYRIHRIMNTKIIDWRDFANEVIFFKIFDPKKIQIIDKGKNYKLLAEDCFEMLKKQYASISSTYHNSMVP